MIKHPHSPKSGGEHVRHWLLILWLTILGLLVAEMPVLSKTRDRVYLLLHKRLERSYKSVVVIAIDQEEFYRGEPRGVRPLDRKYLADTVAMVAAADPTVIGLDVGLETNTQDHVPAEPELSESERKFLELLNSLSRPVILSRTITQHGDSFVRGNDLYDAKPFDAKARVSLGHTSSASDHRQIPTRVQLAGGGVIDSFPIAILRRAMRELPSKLENPDAPWPYSFFLPNSAFVPVGAPVGEDGLLTLRDLRAASDEQRSKWLENQIVLIGGTWRMYPHGGDLVDRHRTPRGELPGVVLHADYIQSLLWDGMYAMPRAWRLLIEVGLAAVISFVFHFFRRWGLRLALGIATLVAVVFFTWLFSAAIGLFFDMVVPVAFLGVHAVWEALSQSLRLEFRKAVRHSEFVFTCAVVLALVVTGAVFIRHERRAKEQQLNTDDRLQVTEGVPPAGLLPERVVEPVLAESGKTQRITKAQATLPIMASLPDKKRSDESPLTPAVPLASPPVPVEAILPPPEFPPLSGTFLPEPPRIAQSELPVPVPSPSPESPSPRSRELRARIVKIEPARFTPNIVLTVVVDHPPQFDVATEAVAFIGATGRCSAELMRALELEFAQQGTAVVGTRQLASLKSDRRGSVLLVRVHRCDEKGLRGAIEAVDVRKAGPSAIVALDVPRPAETSREMAMFNNGQRYDNEPLAAAAATQARRLIFGWTATAKLLYFAEGECAIQGGIERIRDGDLAGALRLADLNLDICASAEVKTVVARAHYNRGLMQFLTGNEAEALKEMELARGLDDSKSFADALAAFFAPDEQEQQETSGRVRKR